MFGGGGRLCVYTFLKSESMHAKNAQKVRQNRLFTSTPKSRVPGSRSHVKVLGSGSNLWVPGPWQKVPKGESRVPSPTFPVCLKTQSRMFL